MDAYEGCCGKRSLLRQDDEKTEASVMAPLPPNAPIGLYVHVPFCAHICPYCDFNTYAGQESLIPRHLDATLRDLERQASSVEGRTAATLYFGGGTPSLVPPAGIGRIVALARERYGLTPDAEITLEANPNSVDEAYFAGLREAGVNRLSLGVQTLDRRGLRTLGRQHEAADAQAAFEAARRAGFDNISLDFIFGWPGQTLDSWRRDLAGVLAWDGSGPEHLSLYSLIIEPGTPMFEAATRGILIPLDDDAAADLYETAI
jgi:oxygen-independent coproporphyrinogen-3 oxidase